MKIKQTETFAKWINKQEGVVKAVITKRINRAASGDRGDWKPIENGVFELRVHFSSGFRIYCKESGKQIIILLCGGKKSTQEADIKKAKNLAKDC